VQVQDKDGNNILNVDTVNGNVGIGTTAPTNILHLYSSNNGLAKIESSDATSCVVFKDPDGLGSIGTRGDLLIMNGGVEGLGVNHLVVDNSGNVGIGVTDPDADLEVTDDCHITDKLTVDGATDPPLVLYDLATRESTYALVERSIPPEKLGGAAMFFNTATKRMEIFVASEGKYYDLQGNVLATVDPITNNLPTKTKARLNQDTGEVKVYQVPDYRAKFEIKNGYKLKADGTFVDDKGLTVTKAAAVEFKDIEKDEWVENYLKENPEAKEADAEAAFPKIKPTWLTTKIDALKAVTQ
jgi:hypothetical protein